MARTKQTARKTCIASKSISRSARGPVSMKKIATGGSGMQKQEELQVPDVVNTQQFSLNFDDQEECEKSAIKSEMFICQRCASYFTCQSTLISTDEYKVKKNSPQLTDSQKQKYLDKHQSVWICEFCRNHNSIPSSYKVPVIQNPCLILADPKKVGKDGSNADNKMLIFCIDISSSMDYRVDMKSRLQSVKQALLDEINRMKFEKEKIKIGIVTFGNLVVLLGDGKAFKQTTLDTGLYKNFDGICKEVGKIKDFCFPIEKSYASLKSTVENLSTYGSTALGPGLLSAVELASQGSVGSKVILCTDGQANVGLGGSFNDDRFTFYSKVAEYAKRKRVMVNILSLKGDRCNLKELGKLSLATGGSIFKIDPQALGTEFNKIIKQNILGTESKLTIKVNRLFKICNGAPDQLSEDKSTLVQDFGNFSAQTILSFQFDTISKEEASKNPNIDLDLYSQKRVPMQVQLEYTGRKGQRYLQIITDWRQITQNFDDIYEGADFQLFAISVLQRTSQKIKNGQYEAAQTILKGYWSLVKEKFQKTEDAETLERFSQRIQDLERVLKSKMKKSNVKFEKKQVKFAGKPSRGRGGKAKMLPLHKEQEEEQVEEMQSDSQEQILYEEIRARDKIGRRAIEMKEKEQKRERSREKPMRKRK